MTKYYIKNEDTSEFELIKDVSLFLWLNKKIYIEAWNYEKRDYEIRELTEEELELERELDDKICEFCNKNKATGSTRTGGAKVYHCSDCVRRLGQDAINSRLPKGSHTEEMLHIVDFLKKVKGVEEITKICSICGESFKTEDFERDVCFKHECIMAKRRLMSFSQ